MEIITVDADFGPGGFADMRFPGVEYHVRGLCGPSPGELSRVVFLDQVHGSSILMNPEPLQEGDGMIITLQGISPGIRTADCLPVFLWSGRCLGAFHAGWRGIAAGIAGRMVREFPFPVEGVILGNCICPDCYEVGDEVRESILTEETASENPSGSVDLALAVLHQMMSAGLDEKTRIWRLAECTKCSDDLFHSYRRNGTEGRNLQWLSI